MTMIVKTINPVIINGKKESRSSKYLSFDANGKPEPSKPNEVKSFQAFAKSKGVDLGTSGTNKDGVDGVWGTKSENAWTAYGSQYLMAMKSLGNAVGGAVGMQTAEPSDTAKVEQAKLGKIWDKTKGWIKSDKAKDTLAFLQNSGGIRGLLGGILGGGSSSQPQQTQDTQQQTYDTSFTNQTPEKKGLSTGAKIGIGVGVAVLLGVVIYAVTRPKTGK